MTKAQAPEPDVLTEKQQRVLDAALEVFAERGFHGASTSEIARRAGVAEGTLFKQFKTKKELLIGSIAPLFVRVVAPMLMMEVRTILQAPHPTVEQFLRALYQNRIAFVLSHARVFKVALQEVPFHDEVRSIATETLSQQLLPHAVALVERFQREGLIRAAPPASIVRVVVGTFFTYAITRVLVAPQRSWDDDAEIELMVAVLAQGLRPPLTAR